MVPSETWLKSSVTDNTIHVDGYNVYRTDRTNKGGGAAFYVRTALNCTVIESISEPVF